MPFSVHEKCIRCGKYDWFLLRSDGKYICDKCRLKEKELELEAVLAIAREREANESSN